jgi:tetrapyrrole methylase family protein/MazG family protein
MTNRVTIVGLGPAGADLIPPLTSAAVESASRVLARTARHPAASALPESTEFCDDLYESSGSIEAVYDAIVARVIAAAARSPVVYAVPGSPMVAEHTVELLIASGVDVEVLPAMSFLDLAWTAMRLDPFALGVTVVDGYDLEALCAAPGPVLIGQLDHPLLLSDIKVSIDPWPEDDPVVLHHLGLADQRVEVLPWEMLDRFEPDHLTSLYLPSVGRTVGRAADRLRGVVTRLRNECPWDAEQTHGSLRRFMLEEAYEAVDAIDRLDINRQETVDALISELGDVAFQVFLHAEIASEQMAGDVGDIFDRLSEKLIRRHPHVFDPDGESATDLELQWEAIKRSESGRSHLLDGITMGLPSLLVLRSIIQRARRGGVEAGRVIEACDAGEIAELIGAAIGCIDRGIDPETALLGWCAEVIEWSAEVTPQ